MPSLISCIFCNFPRCQFFKNWESKNADSHIPRLQRAISIWYKKTLRRRYQPQVLVPNQSCPIHIYGPVIASADIYHIPMKSGIDSFEELEKVINISFPKPKMLILNFPSNPTTRNRWIYSSLKKYSAFAKSTGILIGHDLAYADIVFGGYKTPSILQGEGTKIREGVVRR